MSTDNCKKFIEDLSIEHSLPLKTVWKRTERYKENDLIMRKFENKEGDELLISEDSTGTLKLVTLEYNIYLPEHIKETMSSNHLFSELYKTYLNLTSYSHLTEDELELDNLEPVSALSIRKYLLLNDDSFLKTDLDGFKPNKDDELNVGYKTLYQLSYAELENTPLAKNNFVNDTSSETVGIVYDKENMELYYHEKEGISFFKAICGGDWEVPIHFLVYWSETEGRLKGFFPKGEANIYNVAYGCAYGSEYEKVNESDFPNRAAYDKVMNEADNKLCSIDDNYQQVSDKALNKAFKEMKQIILNEHLSKKMKP